MRCNSLLSSSPLSLTMCLVREREEADAAMLLSFPSLRPGCARGREDGAWEGHTWPYASEHTSGAEEGQVAALK